MESKAPRPLAVVTGASSGIGYHLARCAVEHGYDLVVAADTSLDEAVADFKSLGAQRVDAIQTELASRQGVDELVNALQGREVDALMANAGHGLGGPFLEQDFTAVQHVIDTNVTGTIYLVQQVARGMVARGRGRILITGSIAGFQPGSFHAVYNGSKAFVDSFAQALRNEIQDTGVTVSLLMPGPTDTEFFVRADLLDTKVGADMKKDDPAMVARMGFDAMRKGEADVVTGWKSKAQVIASKVLPAQAVAQAHRKLAEPGSAKHNHPEYEEVHPIGPHEDKPS
ncbi:SDR family NAD(P)-dependent oxidoreductase [Ramlibacter tataouinensis]|uniref:Dehydrogenase/reductase oxidoreductase protein-like protein n=1 Tax=Ramlibacter tataouinensis (strain ATCC BAA-407 / DSM 14655 / LMG 21543 / TTB310) TaxID=365046 RepID=F5Y2B6_RAMTT|nr:SDR family NAD(P)-dependent oxidoreductase [Ramlibacter tataouinensis]AEG91090.1 dehydrogenase/reductase oxidoreductase protein-like protein [Ramlibacter tataouinensis TTB310]